MSSAAIQKWKMFVKGVPQEIGVLASDVPDSAVGGVTGLFSMFTPYSVMQRKGEKPLSYFKGCIVAVVAGFIDENNAPVAPGVYGCTKDVSISPTTGLCANYPNFPETLQTQPQHWDFLFYLPVQFKSCGQATVWIQSNLPQ